MRQAYDTFLLSEVFADLVAKAGSFEPYRYECAHCGEEVRLRATDSTSMVPYFRHQNGNSNVECDRYLGQYGAFSTHARSRKSKNERAEFYFDSNTKMFYLGLRFSEDEISAYEQRSTTFELRVTSQEKPFFTTPINRKNFISDVQKMIPLDKFAYTYSLSNTLNGVKRKYAVFNSTINNAATFFKIQRGDSGGYRAKLVRSSALYTSIPYFITFKSQEICLPDEIIVDSSFEFKTMGKRFFGKIITITTKTTQIESLLSSWGYQLEAAEALTLLWPPAILSEDVFTMAAPDVYLYSTFELQPHGNINVHDEDITKISDSLTNIAIKSSIKVYKKNAELMLETHEQKMDIYSEFPIAYKKECKFKAVDNSSFIFNRAGAFSLSKGTVVPMTPNSKIKHFFNGYLDEIVLPTEATVISKEQLLQDALIHYKKTEPFNWDDFESFDLSQTAFQYIENCERVGVINSATKLLIKEGWI